MRAGHGSPSADARGGDIPYIKVSDLRAGLVNANGSNTVSRDVAERFWHGKESGLSAYDVITPARASKNIGEPVVLLPGQKDVVLTKEVLVFSPGPDCCFDSLYLAWALDLPLVKRQWKRVVFMQTNREDVGARYREIEIPVPPDRAAAEAVSRHYRDYYEGLAALRDGFESAKASQFGWGE